MIIGHLNNRAMNRYDKDGRDFYYTCKEVFHTFQGVYFEKMARCNTGEFINSEEAFYWLGKNTRAYFRGEIFSEELINSQKMAAPWDSNEVLESRSRAWDIMLTDSKSWDTANTYPEKRYDARNQGNVT